MPAVASLAALIKEWPLNSVTLSAATHSKLRKNAGWDRYSSSDLHDQQMDGQDEWSKRYITTEISQERGTIAVLRTPESSGHEASENWEEEEFILGLSPRIDFYLSSTPLMIPLPNVPARPLMKSLLRPSSWAHFFTKFIVLGLLGLGSLTSTVKDPSNQDPTYEL